MRVIQPDDLASLLTGSPVLLMLDVDGTLCPIVERPSAATVPANTRELLRRLASRPEVHVALITGRSVDDAHRMVAVSGIRIHGNHGIELADTDGAVRIHGLWSEAAHQVESAVSELAAALAETVGANVENKRYTLSVHYRDVSPARRDEVIRVTSDIARRNTLRVVGGKMVINLLPPISFDKGTSALALVKESDASRSGAVLFAGDDVTDEDAFRALDRSVPNAVTVKIGPGETAARYRLRDPDELYLALLHFEEVLP